MRKILSFILLLSVLFGGCTFGGFENKESVENIKSSDVASEYIKPEIEAIDRELLPDLPYSVIDNNYIAYEDVSVDELDSYIDSMCKKGFESSKDEYSVLLYNEEYFITIRNNTLDNGSFNITLFKEEINDNPLALSNEEAMKIINDDRLFLVSEQTPEGFFEATGAQYFFAPIHNFDIYPEELCFPVNSGYHIAKYIVTKKNAVGLDSVISSPLVCDINEDGVTDIIVLGYGPTSGLFTISLSMFSIVEGEIVYESSIIYNIRHGEVDICLNENNKPYLIYNPNTYPDDTEEYSAFEILYNEGIYIDSEVFMPWGAK